MFSKDFRTLFKNTANIKPQSVDSLLLTFKRPCKAPTSQSISRWIKGVLETSGVDVSVFSLHSTQHAATSSTAFAAGLSLDIIRKTASWTPESQVFTKFYQRPLANSGSFARTVMLPLS